MNRNLRIVDIGNLFVEERRHDPHEPALGLAFLAKKQHVVLSEDGDIEFWNNGIVVSDDAWIQLVARLELRDEVVVNFLFHAFGTPAAGS